MSLNDRIGRLEDLTPPGNCPTCVSWSHRVELPDDAPSDYELRDRQRRLDRDGPGPLEWPPECPDCGRGIPTVVLAHTDVERPARGSLLAKWLRQEDEP